MAEQETISPKAYRVDFTYTEQAAIHIAAMNETEASAGALAMLKARVKNPVVTRVTDVTEPDLSEELGPVNKIVKPETVLN